MTLHSKRGTLLRLQELGHHELGNNNLKLYLSDAKIVDYSFAVQSQDGSGHMTPRINNDIQVDQPILVATNLIEMSYTYSYPKDITNMLKYHEFQMLILIKSNKLRSKKKDWTHIRQQRKGIVTQKKKRGKIQPWQPRYSYSIKTQRHYHRHITSRPH
ncbi:21703_t:CDS:2 [Dentiscutata erythropus]|uniref:21703_t:CDS:1 n=1 Tax=Dentiscutata erythropus TaxID=1348616 RepID=A0A9N8VGC6_9GLOM|nr:21703_t:CDS:2 [Dentiscutata erythropus]